MSVIIERFLFMGGIVNRSLAMVRPFAIAKAFGLDAATRRTWPGEGG